MKTDAIMSGAPAQDRDQVTLANWRVTPFNRWSFHRVREIIPTAEISAGPSIELGSDAREIAGVAVEDGAGYETTVRDVLERSHASGLVVLKSGRMAGEWFGNGYDGRLPHILFSISKSITSLLAGILADHGMLDPDASVAKYIPEVEGSAYGDCTVRHVLDMTVSTSFKEVYLDPDGDFARYRVATGWNPPIDGTALDLRQFLLTLKPDDQAHGAQFHYLSPNSDLLGWIIERAANGRIADLLSKHFWVPMGAGTPASITLDRLGAPRTAGGISTRLHDLARVGELMRCRGKVGDTQVVPAWWVDDIIGPLDKTAWLKGDMVDLFPAGGYRSKWYQTGNKNSAFCAIGIHGQWLYINPASEVVIAKSGVQPEPVDDPVDQLFLRMFEALSDHLASKEV